MLILRTIPPPSSFALLFFVSLVSPWAAASEMPEDLKLAFESARYGISIDPSSGVNLAENAANHFSMKFSGAQTIIEAGKGEQSIITFSSYGWGSTLRPVGPLTQMKSAGNRIDRRYGVSLHEWFQNTPKGLEQGFTLAHRENGARGPLRIRLSEEGGWHIDGVSDGVKLTKGSFTFHYAGLKAWDANGVALTSTMRALTSAIEIEVNDAHAVYPLTIDPTLTQQGELTAGDSARGDFFGHSVALSTDGSTALIGANGNSVQGAAYVFTRLGSSWILQQKLTMPDAAYNDQFGYSVALSGDGSTALVGAVRKNSVQGAAYVFTRSGGSWTQQQELTASDGASGDQFGNSVALSSDGNTALMGAVGKNSGEGTTGQGAAYVFTRSGNSWTQQQKLIALDAAIGDEFGYAVALSSDATTAVMGAVNKDSGQGAAYLFTRSGSSWTQQQELIASDAAAGDEFGYSVALSSDGTTVLTGAVNHNSAQGVAYVFARSGSSWSQQQELTGSDVTSQAFFGSSVALSGDGSTALVGAGIKNTYQGAAYMLTRSGSSWTQQQELTASDVSYSHYFGFSVALSGDGSTSLVGAIYSSSTEGTAYVFTVPATVPAVTVGTNISGASFSVDGTSYSSTQAFNWTVGSVHTLSVKSPQMIGSAEYGFAQWSDGTTGLSDTITVPSAGGTYTAYFSVVPTPQAITFGAIPVQLAGGALGLTATASSGLAISYSASPASVCTVNGAAASFVGAGMCSITASQAGNSVYSAATPVTQTFNVTAGYAAYLGSDALTQGTWTGVYGGDGYVIPNQTTATPSYASVNVTGGASYTWASSTADPRALQTANGASTRIASTYYSGGSFNINVNLTDGKAHRVALYLLDWDSSVRAETVSILNATTNAVLSKQTFSTFHSGVWAAWTVSGNVIIQVTDTAGANAVVAGVFFDPAPPAATAKYVGLDATTQGTWTGARGADGNIIATETAVQPSYATVVVNGAAQYSWAPSTSDPRALQTVSGSTARVASTYYASNSFAINLSLTDGNTHRVALYLLDWDGNTRAETITVSDANTQVPLDTESYSNFHGGVYAMWDLSGSVTITVTNAGGANAVVAGLFFDPTPTVAPASASYMGTDTITKGVWTGKYGSSGQLIVNDLNNPPSFATVNVSGASAYTWNPSTTDLRALQNSSSAMTGIASTYYAFGTFSINLNLTDGLAHRVSLYLLDWDSTARAETITVTDANTHVVLDSENYSNFHGGVYATWNITGNVMIAVTNNTGGTNAVVAGIFFDPTASVAASASYVGTDSSTLGAWTGQYGSAGELIANDLSHPPAFASIGFAGANLYTWNASTNDPRALQSAAGSTIRDASAYYAFGTFTFNVNLTDGNTHKVSLYLLDWDSTVRAETISIFDANTHLLLNSQSYSSFNGGQWAVWNVKGNVIIQVTDTSGANAVVSGIFFD